MNDIATGTLDNPDGGGLVSFLVEAVRNLRDPRMRLPAGLLLVILTFSNIILLFNIPAAGEVPSYAFLAAAFVRVGGLLVLSMAILRIATASDRNPWRPDGAFWLYAVAIIVGFGMASLVGSIVGDGDELSGIALRNVITSVVLSLFAPWVAATAVATPLGWNPARFLHSFGRWLPGLIVWTLVLVVPMGVMHAIIDLHLIDGAGDWFWPLALFDGPLSAVMALLGLGLNAEAYRRVAQR